MSRRRTGAADQAPQFRNAAVRVWISAAVGIVVGVLVSIYGTPLFAPAYGWDAAAISFLALTWGRLWPMDAEMTRTHATREDATQRTTDIVVATAAAASLASVLILLLGASTEDDHSRRLVRVGIGLATIVVSWFVIHTVFALRYARTYYADPVGGINFNQKNDPQYSDFAYIAYVIGMTFQVSDTNIGSHAMRMNILRHGLFSYLFGTFIAAAAVNLFVALTA